MKAISSFLCRQMVSLGIVAGSTLIAHGAAASMLQAPLQVGGSGIPPNLIFTLDDSGSMWLECVPDSLCVGRGGGIESIPGRSQISTYYRAGSAVYDDVPITSNNNSSIVRAAAPNLLSRQMRSSASNPLYYDPAVRYQPWLRADGTRWPNANPAAAPVHPTRTDKTQNLTGVQDIGNNTWILCTGNESSCLPSGRQKAHIARYYTRAGTGNSANDFTLVLIQAGKSYPKSANRTDCSGSSCSYNEEIQNFANWYTYYRYRALTAVSGTAEAFISVPESYRVGYGRINKGNSTDIDGVAASTVERGVREFSGTNREAFYTWLAQTLPNAGTPLRRAMSDVGEYLRRRDNRGPWGANPGTNDPSQHSACRRSTHLLMTDGMWNGAAASNAEARLNVDAQAGPTITGPGGQSYTYTPANPYRDDSSGTLADVAMYYWKTDLRPDLANAITPITKSGKENPAFWQHMVNFTIAFGVDGTLNNPSDLPALTNGTKSWGNPGAGNTPQAIDDLWHAAINSRGRALSARNAAEYSEAVKSIIDDLIAIQGSEAGVAAASELPRVSGGSKIYTPSFETPGWNGDIKADTIDTEGNVVSAAWSAAAKLPAHGVRRIFTFNPATTGNKGMEFKWASLSDAMKTDLWGATTGGEALVNYLRGSDAGEGTLYRDRVSPLGDIVNSTPALIYDQLDMRYEYLPSGQDYGSATYRRFLKAKSLRQAQLAVGANDGMLHIFNDDTGVESFAYMPRAVLSSVKQLWNVDYAHRYFVDGPIYEADVYDKNSSRWRNLVQGFGGAGGKFLYTINMPTPNWASGNTAPSSLSAADSAPAASDILWEISSSAADFSEMGYVLTKPETGVLPNGTWVTIFGNGYESTSGKAQLFIVNALTGALVKRIDTGAGSANLPNGLGGVGVVRDSQQRIVAAYAGDLAGNLWKFDLSSTSPANWNVAFGGQPLFKARNDAGQAEPISAKPTFRAFPTGGVMVLFGTGKLFASGDESDMSDRTLYGVWDKVPVGSGAGTAADALADSSSLVTQHTVVTPIPGTVNAVYRKLNVTSVDYTTKRGWRLPLVIGDGERMIDEPQVFSDLVLMQSVTTSDVGDECQAASLMRRGYLLDPFMSNKRAPAFDGDADGTRESSIVDLGGTGRHIIVTKPGDEGSAILGAGGSALAVPKREGAIRRYWRQIVTPPI